MSRPKVSIGVPVYNGARTLASTLDSLLGQSFGDFEIVISDNASTDETAAICAGYAAQDGRIRYIRQANNVGPGLNFKYVLFQARAPYFMWSAADDVRSPEFLQENVRFLEANDSYVASTCPNRLEGRDNVVSFSMKGTVIERFATFLDNSWISHGIFYSVVRTDVLQQCEVIGEQFLGIDWAVDLFLASRGNVHRTQKGLMISGVAGTSSEAQAWQLFREPFIGWVLPFYRVGLYALRLSSGCSLAERLWLIGRLLRLNASAAYYQFRSEFYPAYSTYVRPWLRSAYRSLKS